MKNSKDYLSEANSMVEKIDVKKHLAPKAIFFTRPSVMPYTALRSDLELSADRLFRIMKEGKIKIDIAHKYSLDEAQKSHEDLHARKLIGPAILIELKKRNYNNANCKNN